MFKKETDLSKFIGLPVWTLPRLDHTQSAVTPSPPQPSTNASTSASASSAVTSVSTSVSTGTADMDEQGQQQDRGVIEGTFGKTGKFKVGFAKGSTSAAAGDRIVLKLLKSVFGSSNPDKLLAA
jgi:hypothetical protein